MINYSGERVTAAIFALSLYGNRNEALLMLWLFFLSLFLSLFALKETGAERKLSFSQGTPTMKILNSDFLPGFQKPPPHGSPTFLLHSPLSSFLPHRGGDMV